jgi:tetratricopeptide (TPR) repeat protein
MRTFAILIVFAVAALGQRHKPPEEVDAEKPDGKLMQQIMQESDAAKKNALMEQFATEFPKTPHTGWVLESVQGYYAKANQHDQVIAFGDKLLALDPDDPEAALQSLKAAEAKKDVALIKKYSDATAKNARKIATAPQPKEADEVDSWKKEVEYAKQVGQYADYSIFRLGVESRDPKVTIEMAELLQQRGPEGEYAIKMREPMFVAYRQAGANDKAIALAEKILATEQKNEDMLLVVADHYLQTKKEPEKVHAYSAKIVEIMSAKPKPEGASDADWTARKNLVTGLAHFMSGKLYASENKHSQADAQLRKALPLIEANPALKPETLFLLGLSNYRMASGSPERAQDSATYFRQCAALKSPFQGTAATNLKRILTEYRGIK